MIRRTTFIAGAAIGYVLGTRAGRARYDQIAASAQRLWRHPAVHDRAVAAQEQAKDRAKDFARDQAPDLQQKLAEIAHQATDAAQRATEAARERLGSERGSADPEVDALVPDPQAPHPARPTHG